MYVGNCNNKVGCTIGPTNKKECEVIMIVGLPGAGKTTLALKAQKEHPEKKYNIIGTDALIDKMRVMGLPRKRNYHGRWDQLISLANNALNKLFLISSKRNRNIIIDQTNVYATAQNRKIRPYVGFKCIAWVVVPTDHELERRAKKRTEEDGKEVPDSAILEMKANFKLPQSGEFLDEVVYIELGQSEAEKLVTMYNQEGKKNRPPRDVVFQPKHDRFASQNNSSKRHQDQSKDSYKSEVKPLSSDEKKRMDSTKKIEEKKEEPPVKMSPLGPPLLSVPVTSSGHNSKAEVSSLLSKGNALLQCSTTANMDVKMSQTPQQDTSVGNWSQYKQNSKVQRHTSNPSQIQQERSQQQKPSLSERSPHGQKSSDSRKRYSTDNDQEVGSKLPRTGDIFEPVPSKKTYGDAKSSMQRSSSEDKLKNPAITPPVINTQVLDSLLDSIRKSGALDALKQFGINRQSAGMQNTSQTTGDKSGTLSLAVKEEPRQSDMFLTPTDSHRQPGQQWKGTSPTTQIDFMAPDKPKAIPSLLEFEPMKKSPFQLRNDANQPRKDMFKLETQQKIYSDSHAQEKRYEAGANRSNEYQDNYGSRKSQEFKAANEGRNVDAPSMRNATKANPPLCDEVYGDDQTESDEIRNVYFSQAQQNRVGAGSPFERQTTDLGIYGYQKDKTGGDLYQHVDDVNMPRRLSDEYFGQRRDAFPNMTKGPDFSQRMGRNISPPIINQDMRYQGDESHFNRQDNYYQQRGEHKMGSRTDTNCFEQQGLPKDAGSMRDQPTGHFSQQRGLQHSNQLNLNRDFNIKQEDKGFYQHQGGDDGMYDLPVADRNLGSQWYKSDDRLDQQQAMGNDSQHDIGRGNVEFGQNRNEKELLYQRSNMNIGQQKMEKQSHDTEFGHMELSQQIGNRKSQQIADQNLGFDPRNIDIHQQPVGKETGDIVNREFGQFGQRGNDPPDSQSLGEISQLRGGLGPDQILDHAGEFGQQRSVTQFGKPDFGHQRVDWGDGRALGGITQAAGSLGYDHQRGSAEDSQLKDSRLARVDAQELGFPSQSDLGAFQPRIDEFGLQMSNREQKDGRLQYERDEGGYGQQRADIENDSGSRDYGHQRDDHEYGRQRGDRDREEGEFNPERSRSYRREDENPSRYGRSLESTRERGYRGDRDRDRDRQNRSDDNYNRGRRDPDQHRPRERQGYQSRSRNW